MGIAQSWSYKTFSFARQADLVTEASTDFIRYACEVAIPKRGREVADLDYATGQWGSRRPVVVGARQGGEISIKAPLCGLRSGYNPATSAPGDANLTTPPIAILLANALGSRNASVSSAAGYSQGVGLYNEAYDGSAVVSSSTTSVVNLDTGLGAGILLQSLLAIGVPSTNALRQLGWVSEINTDAITLVEAWSQAASNGDNVLPSATACLNQNEQIPMTFIIRGAQASFVDVAVGCVAKSIKIMCEAGQVPMVEITYGVFGDMRRDSTGGAVQVPDDDWPVLRPVVGAFGGRLTVDGTVTCGVEKLTIDIALDVQPRLCHSALQGVSQVDTVSKSVTVSFSAPRDSADTVDADGNDPWQTALANASEFSIAAYVGEQAGNIWSCLIAPLTVSEEPQLEDVGGRVYVAVKTRPAAFAGLGDGTITGTAPQNSVLSMGWA